MKKLRLSILTLAILASGACNATDATGPIAGVPSYDCSGVGTGSNNGTGCP